MKFGRNLGLGFLLVSAMVIAPANHAQTPVSNAKPSFEKDVQPVFAQVCNTCHNDKLSSGGMDIAAFNDPASIETNREGWEKLLARLRTGEMPPSTFAAKPNSQQVTSLIGYVQ